MVQAEEGGAPRLPPEHRGQQQPGIGVPGLTGGATVPGWNDYTLDPLNPGGPVMSGGAGAAPWTVTDQEAPWYDLHVGDRLSEAGSSAPVTTGAPTGPAFGGDRRSWSSPLEFRRPTQVRNAISDYWSMNSEQRAQWQKRMYDAGFLGEEPAVWGQPDPRGHDFTAWTNMVKTASRLGIPMTQMADQLAEAGAGDALRGGGGQQRRRPDIPLTSRVDAKRIAEAVGVELMGRAPTDDETKRAISRLHALEKGAGQRQGDAHVSEEGGNVYERGPSAQAAIEADLERQNPEEVRAHDTVEQFAGFLQILGDG